MSTSFTQMFEINRSGLMMRMADLDVVSNNLANINTTGYKAQRTNFQELLNQVISSTDQTQTITDITTRNVLNGTQIISTQMLASQGALKDSERPLDLAIEGEGFFGVSLPDGTIAYTRDGTMFTDGENNLVNGAGYPLVWDGALPENGKDFSITASGDVVAIVDGVEQVVGTIPLFRFVNTSGLSLNGENLLLASPASGAAEQGTAGEDGFGSIASSMLEGSNVNMSEEITRMISLQRGFELSIRALQQADTMLSQALQMRQI